MGITHMGDKLEELLMEELGAVKGKRKICDVVLYDETFEINIESKDKTPNQTRPWKYNILVIRHENKFYVIPAHQVVIDCLPKSGQHALDPVACYKPSFTKEWKEKYICEFKDLKNTIIKYYKEDYSDKNKPIRSFIEKRYNEWMKQIEENKKFLQSLQHIGD